jgi:hypothetical protein
MLGGDLYVSGNLQILGSSTNVNIQSNTVEIGDNIILVNAYTPFQRYAGITGNDSGSVGVSGSLLWDSQIDEWIVVNGTSNSSRVIGTTFAAGPGFETSLTSGTFPIATANNTIGDSLLKYSGSTLDFNSGKFQVESVSGNTVVAGTLEIQTNGSDLTGGRSNVTFKNSNNILGEVSTTDTTDVLAGILGYDASTGYLKFSTVIDGGTF